MGDGLARAESCGSRAESLNPLPNHPQMGASVKLNRDLISITPTN